MSEGQRTDESFDSGQAVAKLRPSKGHVDYWKARLFHPFYTRGGERLVLKDFAVRIQYLGRRETFNLGPNSAKAAESARQIYGFLEANGWDVTLAKYKPAMVPKDEVATVGGLIAAAGRVATIRPTSLRFYANAIRLIAAEISGIEAGMLKRTKIRRSDGKPGNPRLARVTTEEVETSKAVRFARGTPEFAKWRARVDAVTLASITPELVSRWRARRIAARGDDPKERESARVSADSIIRGAKALFGKRILPHISRDLTLPSPLPFASVAVGKSARRFRAEVNAQWLFSVGRSELEATAPEAWKAFVLCLACGLRRSEADTLTWQQVNLDDGLVEICRTEFFEPKSAESARMIDLADETVDLLRAFKGDDSPDPVFVLKGGKAKPFSKTAYYRADCVPWRTWEKLGAWLKAKGITETNKPIHALRKLAGSLVHESFGIEAARDFLGHADVATTSASYLAKRPRVVVHLGRNTVSSEKEGTRGHA